MARADKAAAVAELTGRLNGSQAAVLTEYRGLTVAQLRELRSALAGTAEYAVVKNTLARIAAREAGVDALVDLLEGPSAIAFVTGDPVAAAKGLRDYARANPALVLKGGVLQGRALSAEEVARLADLESRDVLLARIAGALQAPMAAAARTLAAPASTMARLFAARRAQAEGAETSGAAA
jgi:large subunit ribosomal protein L10